MWLIQDWGRNATLTLLGKLIEIAMACTPDTSIQRPNMSNVVSELKDCLAIERSHPRTCSSRMEETDRCSDSVEMAPNHMRWMTGGTEEAG